MMNPVNSCGSRVVAKLVSTCEIVRPGVRKVSKKATTERVSRRKGRSSSGFVGGSGVAASDRRGSSRNESGAVLLLALAYIVAVGMIVGALADWAMNDLNNTTKFNAASELSYAVSSVTTTAIQSIRYAPLPSTPTSSEYGVNGGAGQPTGLGNCWTPAANSPASQLTIDTYTVAVWCNTVINLSQATTRTVTLYACLSSLTSASLSSAVTQAQQSCQNSPLLTAVVIFDDYPSGGGLLLTSQCNLAVGQCGEGQTLVSWNWS